MAVEIFEENNNSKNTKNQEDQYRDLLAAQQKAKEKSLLSHRCSTFTNCIMVSVSILTLLFSLVIYIHWRGRDLVFSLQELIQFHMIICSIIIMSFISICLGILTLRALSKTTNIMLGISVLKTKLTLVATYQIFGLIFLMTIKVGIIYAIVSEWYNNLDAGITFAVQSFNPKSIFDLNTTMDGIQYGLHCCGRNGADDYKISNAALLRGYVPLSCCDLSRYTLKKCQESLSENKEQIEKFEHLFNHLKKRHEFHTRPDIDRNDSIPIEMAFKVGCRQRLNQVVLPVVLAIFLSMIFCEALCIGSSSQHIKVSNLLEEINEELMVEKNLNSGPYLHVLKPSPSHNFPLIDEEMEENDTHLTNRNR